MDDDYDPVGDKKGDHEGKGEHKIPRAFLALPIPNPIVEWEKDEAGLVTLIYKKNFGKFEKWLHSKIGGPENIRRPLDEPGSRIWVLMDGEHTVAEICMIIDQEFKEEMSPVFKKVRHFLEQLLILNLIILNPPEGEDAHGDAETEKEVDEEKENQPVPDEEEKASE